MTPRALSVCFFFSGFCGLIDEVIWERWLELKVGVTTYAAAVIIGSFMGGMALGGVLLGRRSDRSRHPLRVYAACELALGFFALCMPSVLRAVPAKAGLWTSAWVLALPAILMGGTVPSLYRYARATNPDALSFGWLYGINILGGVLGSLGATFLFFEALGARATNMLAAAISIIIGGATWKLSSPVKPEPPRRAVDLPLVLLIIAFLCGAFALATEVLWIRALRLIIGGTVYSFGTMLATYLLGLSIGSVVATRLPRRPSDPLWWVGVTQAAAAFFFAALFPAFTLNWSLLAWFGKAYFYWIHAWHVSRLIQFLIAGSVMFLPALLMGMAIPLLVRALERSSGSGVGTVYGANSLGAVAGSVIAGLMLLPQAGLEGSGRLVYWLQTAFGVAVIVSSANQRARWAALPVIAVLLVLTPRLHGAAQPGVLYFRDGVVSSVKVYRQGSRKVLETDNLDVQGMDPAHPLTHPKRLGYLPLILHPGEVGRALQIGLGTGINLAALAEGAQEVTVVELIPEMPEAVAYFRQENGNVLDRPNVVVKIGDGRHWTQSKREEYDLIVADLFYPENAGTATLYSQEHFGNCRQALKPGGVMVQWIPAHQMSLDSLRMLMATFLTVFPDATLWWGTESEAIPTLALVGGIPAGGITTARIASAMRRFPGTRDVGWLGADCVRSLEVMSSKELAEFARDASLNTDDRPEIEFDAPKLETRRQAALFEVLMTLADMTESHAVPEPSTERLLRARAEFGRSRAWRSIGDRVRYEHARKSAITLAPQCKDLSL